MTARFLPNSVRKKGGGRTPEFPNSIREFRCATPLFLCFRAAPPDVARVGLRAAEGLEALIGSVANEGFQPQPYGVRVSRGSACVLGSSQKSFVDIDRFLHVMTLHIMARMPRLCRATS